MGEFTHQPIDKPLTIKTLQKTMSRNEFGFIDYIKDSFAQCTNNTGDTGKIGDTRAGEDGRTKGIGDDCAVIPIDRDTKGFTDSDEILFSTDLLMEGVHFLREESSPEDVGWKAAAVNLSDIAAMGGTPTATFLSIALPKDAQGEWAERFISGYAQISKQYNVPLLGGDTTSSLRDIAINVGVMGKCPAGKALCRDGARVGDTVFVTGPLGDSAGGLQVILKGVERGAEEAVLVERHKRPVPRVAEGKALRETGLVGAMMDISDGIASDLRHILKASGVGAEVDLARLPISEELASTCKKYGWDAHELAAGGGEDFELLFTAPAEIADMVDFPIYPIGRIVAGSELSWLHKGSQSTFDTTGYKHF